ncbi:ATP-binding protein [Glaciimonas sp. PAMC28666]|uniref:ATP-binding protein n=1 Tax=Glaciimonas sp. PAMC28666 TaxID=2807626 RepID=UPI0019642410|nr:ATP-binding protein [Glaciimonas sp. PAMC28666]QRX82584.1 response regulator [Glaciimonas sp. PAMC28666]
MAYSALSDRITTISRRFLQVRTYLIVALLSLLLGLYVGLLLLFMLWDRSESAHENYADLLRQISRQEYFIGKFSEMVPGYICGMRSPCKNHADQPAGLPPLGQAAPLNEEFWILRSAAAAKLANLGTPNTPYTTNTLTPPTTGQPVMLVDQAQQEWQALGRRLADFHQAFWGYRVSSDQSVLTTADGSVAMYTLPTSHAQPATKEIGLFLQKKRIEFERILRDYPGSHNADGIYWTRSMTDPLSGRTIFTCFIPFRDSRGKVIGYAATDVSPDNVLTRTRMSGNAFQQGSGLVLIYAYTGRLMLIDGRKPTPEEIAYYRNLDGGQEYKYHRSSLQFRPKDAMLQVSYAVPNIEWRVVYAVSLWTLMQDRIVPIGGGVLLFLLCVAAVLRGTRRINRAVIGPAAMQAKRLAESENFNRTIVETSPVGLAVLRARDGEIILNNAQFVPLVRWRLFDTADRVLSGDAWKTLVSLVQSRQPTKQEQPIALLLEDTKQGHFYQIGIATAMHEDEPVFICVLSDMTDRKRTEQTLAEARRLAESISASKSLFLATISHEIRTPLYGMLASIELMAKTRLDDAQRQLSRTMDGSARTLKDVLNDALDFTKGEVEAVELDHQELDLVKDIETVVQGFWSRASLKNLQLHCLIDPSLEGLWWGDSLKLTQVLNNLINNAVKFTQQGSVMVIGQLLSNGPAGSRIALSVRDTGPGINHDDAERIFQPFGQANGAVPGQQFPGTGLGLFICKKFVAAMDGTVSVDSLPEKGSTFVVTITLSPAKLIGHAERLQRTDGLSGLSFSINAIPEFARHLSSVLISKGGNVDQVSDISDSRDHYSARIDIIDIIDAADGPHVPDVAGKAAIPALQRAVFLDLSFPYRPFLKGHQGYANSLSGSAVLDAVLMVAGRKEFIQEAEQSAMTGSLRRLDADILIVDDQAINRLLLEKQLAYFGGRISAVGSGAEALELIKAGEHFDLILTDLNMPLMNGYELAHALRALAVSCPIIAVTASLLAGERERGEAAGMNGYMIKPFAMDDLEKLLERHVGFGTAPPTGPPAAMMIDESDREEAIAAASAIASQMWRPDMLRAAVISITEDLALLEAAIGRSDLVYLGEVAHRIHGGMAALDMRPATALCHTIEESVEYEWQEEAFRLAPVLQQMLLQIRQDIDPEDD